jgi:hypothetical protein
MLFHVLRPDQPTHLGETLFAPGNPVSGGSLVFFKRPTSCDAAIG